MRSQEWAIRCMHEASLHEVNVFVTLTYDDEHLPPGGTLVKRDFQLFMKRLRKHSATPIRFFAAGEYGEELCRPHYHALLFGIDFADRRFEKATSFGDLYQSDKLTAIWGMGRANFGTVSYKSARYVAGYINKKITGPPAKDHYGELLPEFGLMSRREGIGKRWFAKYSTDIYPDDFVVADRRIAGKPPKFYDKELEVVDPELLAAVKRARVERAATPKQEANSTKRRLKDRETVHKAKLSLRKRNLS